MTKNSTPGPWKIAPDPKHLTAAPLVISSNRNIAKVLYHGGSEDNQVDANASLIAAAPELLEALEGIIDFSIDDWTDANRWSRSPQAKKLEQARVAIAKAKGHLINA